MGFSIEQTLKPSSLTGRAGPKPTSIDITRKREIVTAGEHPTPQAKLALVNRRPDAAGLLRKVDFVA